jgi:hypothetical protein
MHEGPWLVWVCVAALKRLSLEFVCLTVHFSFTLSLAVVCLCRLRLVDNALTMSCVSYTDNYGCNEHIDATNCSGASGQPEPSGLHPRCCLTA